MKSSQTIASSVIRVALKIYESVDKSINVRQAITTILDFSLVDLTELNDTSKIMMNFAKTFKKNFPNQMNVRT